MGRRDTEKIKKKLDDGGFRENRMVLVTDDWYPCFPGNQVSLTIMVRRSFGHKDSYYAKICAWGADDTGVEMEYMAGDCPESAYSIYEHWKRYIFGRVPDGVNMEGFYEHGFYPA